MNPIVKLKKHFLLIMKIKKNLYQLLTLLKTKPHLISMVLVMSQ